MSSEGLVFINSLNLAILFMGLSKNVCFEDVVSRIRAQLKEIQLGQIADLLKR
jgi:hypothetical protein